MNGNISKLNIVLVGNYEIGKSIIEEFTDENKGNFFSFISEDSASISIKNKNNDVFNFSISYAGSCIGPYSAIKKFSENASAVFMVYDKQKEESFKRNEKHFE